VHAIGALLRSTMHFPQISIINQQERLLFFNNDPAPFPCAFCSRDRIEPAVVRSGGTRIDVFYSKEPLPEREDRTLVADPICWVCVRDRSHGAEGSSQEWRTAAARFLNALHASDPGSYYCGIRSLD
jgi:hypothetical protein